MTFRIDPRRNGDAAKKLLGEAFSGVLCVDRYGAYTWATERAWCWSHLLRDFEAMAERHSSPWHGGRLAELARQMLAVHRRWQAGEIDRTRMEAEVAPLKAKTVQLLEWTAAGAPGLKAQATAANLLKDQDAMWRWLADERVPPTNNHAERELRYGVIWRKLSYGTDSVAGSVYVARLLTTVGTLQLQGRDVFEYLTAAVAAHTAGQVVPSLLPQAVVEVGV